MISNFSAFRRRVFVVMPFGEKDVPKKPGVDSSAKGGEAGDTLRVNFNDVYEDLFKPALEAAGLQPFRADDEEAAGDILKDMFAELVTADFVLADISILNANVFYELGIRHTIGPRGVICVHAGWADRPFDVAPQRTFKYDGTLFKVGLAHDEEWKNKVAAEVTRLGETLRKAVAADRTTEGSPVYGNLTNLVPPDASRIGTGRFRHYQTQSDEWKQRVTIAGREGRAEEILTLAGDVPSPYYRRKLLFQCGDALHSLRRFEMSRKICEELHQELEGTGSMEEFRVECRLAMLANRLGHTSEAEIKLNDLLKKYPDDGEAQILLGRVYKDMWRTTWSFSVSLEERLTLAWRNALIARKAISTYDFGFRRDLDSYYNGINVIALSSLLDYIAHALNETVRPEVPDLEDLKTVVRLGATAKLADRNDDNSRAKLLARSTLGELRLISGEPREAFYEYTQLAADPGLTLSTIHSIIEHVELFQLLGYKPETVDPISDLLKERRKEFPQSGNQFDKIAICSGHMIDAPDREVPRFPAEKEEAVRAEIERQLAQWHIGPGDLAICGGACGADILFAEESLKRGAQIRLLLSQEVDDFVRDSVRHAGDDWVQRFYALREKATVATQPERLGKAPPDVSIFARTNLWMINSARVEAADNAKIHALMVWDEKPTGDGSGGTSDFEQSTRDLGGHIAIINPTKLP